MSDLRQGKEYAAWMKSLGWQVEKGAFIKKLPLLPISFIKIQRQKRLSNLKVLAKKFRAIVIKIEPDLNDKTNYLALGFKKDKTPMLPTKTIWLDLKKSEERLLKEMHYKTRYNLRKFSGKVEIIRGDKVKNKQLKGFYQIYRLNCKKQKFWGLNFNHFKNLFSSFGRRAWLLKTKGGGLIVLIYKKTAYYSHNASSHKGREKQVATGLTWRAVKLAKELGCFKFDFEGITDERFLITKKWQGFTRFKKSFGGSEVEYRRPIKKMFLKESFWLR